MADAGAPKGDFSTDPDTTLMIRFAAGDEAAFDKIVANFQRQIFGVIYRYIGDWALAEDCAQEVFLRVYRMKHSYRATARLSTLVYRITTNLCLNTLRDQGRRQALSLDAPRSGDDAPLSAALESPGARTAEEELVTRERAEIVRRALARIPGRQRIALVLHRFEALSYAQIAEAMDTNAEAVKALLARARQSLAETLRADIEAGNL